MWPQALSVESDVVDSYVLKQSHCQTGKSLAVYKKLQKSQ